MFFGKSKPAVTKFKISPLLKDRIAADIRTISKNEEQRNELYTCIGDEIPKHEEYEEFISFVEKTAELKKSYEEYLTVMNRVQDLKTKVQNRTDELRRKCETFVSNEKISTLLTNEENIE